MVDEVEKSKGFFRLSSARTKPRHDTGCLIVDLPHDPDLVGPLGWIALVDANSINPEGLCPSMS